MCCFKFVFSVIFYLHTIEVCKSNTKLFPEDFLFGVSSSAYQIEGGYNVNGKGRNIWDFYTRQNNFISNSSNGNTACDSYRKYKEDVKLLTDLGVQFYRFSISWSRILPKGYSNVINKDGITYYNNLINELLANDIQPMVTLYHWDLPKPLQDIGGWTNIYMAYYFEDYANVVFSHFGDRVKYWITINSGCHGYKDNKWPPQINQPGVADYLCNHVQILAHARVYHLYDKEYRSVQNGKIGLTLDAKWYDAASNNPLDIEAGKRTREFQLGITANPILHPEGDYPEIVKKRVSEQSKKDGYLRSRLPVFSREEIDYVQGTFDFLGLNIYTAILVKHDANSKNDMLVKMYQAENWPKSHASWLRVTPWALRKVLKWFKNKYDDPEIFITENGYADQGELNDNNRIRYIEMHLESLLESIHEDKVNVKGYAVWSFLDNFEWLDGYSVKFGLYNVDFNDPERKRTAKASAEWYKQLLKKRELNF